MIAEKLMMDTTMNNGISSMLFENKNRNVIEDEKKETKLNFFSRCLEIVEDFVEWQIIFKHHIFDEAQAARYLRCPIPTIRYHALRSKKLSFRKFTKDGLVFQKQALDDFLNNVEETGYRGF